MIGKVLFGLMSPSGSKARLQILIFHRVLPRQDPLLPDEMFASRFDTVCRWLASWFAILPLDQAVRQLQEGCLPARAACITFDDGYADNCQVALPILQRYGLAACFFVSTGFLDGGRMWNDSIIEAVRDCKKDRLDLDSFGLGSVPLGTLASRRAAISALIDQVKYRPVAERLDLVAALATRAHVALPSDLMMTSDEVRALRHAGMQIGAHTVSHPILAELTDTEARQEIQGSKAVLEQLLGEHVGLFAYPNGKPGKDYTQRCVDIVRSAGFDAAVSTQWGTSSSGDDLFQIRRFTPWDQGRLRFGARMLSNLRIR